VDSLTAPRRRLGARAAQVEGGKGVTSFGKRDGLYGVQIITGPRSVLLRLELLDERTEDFEVAAYTTEGPYRDPTPDVVRARVLEGTDEANREFGTSFHPWLARYSIEDYSDESFLLRRAAYSIVARLARLGESGYEGLS
jgi:hypothetical protein